MSKVYNILFLFITIFCFVQCEVSNQNPKDDFFIQLQKMDKHPKKALELLDNVSKYKDLTHEEQLKWELLHFMYKYKENYQSIKKDDYILNVRDYFQKKDRFPFYKGYAMYYAGIYYLETTMQEQALQQFLDLIPYAKQSNQLNLFAKTCYSIGRTYYLNRNYALARSYYRKSIYNYEKLKDLSNIPFCYNNLGNAYLLEKNFDSALYYYHLSLDLAQQLKDTLQIASVLQNIGITYRFVKNPKQEMAYLKQALLLQKSPEHIVKSCTSLAKGYYKSKQYDSANYYLQKIASHIHEIDNPYLLYNYYKTKATLSLKRKKYEEAINYFNTYTQLYDSITKQITENQLLEVENDHKRKLLKQRLQSTEKQQKIYYLVLSIAIIFIILLLWLLLQLRRKNQTILQSDKILQHQKKEIEQKAEELEQHAEQLVNNHEILKVEALKSQFLFALYKIYAAPYIDLNASIRTYEDEMLIKGYDFKKALESLLKNLHKNRKKTKQLIEKEAHHFLEELGFTAQGGFTADDYLYLALIFCDYDRKDVMELLNTPTIEALTVRRSRIKTKIKKTGASDKEIEKWLKSGKI